MDAQEGRRTSYLNFLPFLPFLLFFFGKTRAFQEGNQEGNLFLARRAEKQEVYQESKVALLEKVLLAKSLRSKKGKKGKKGK